MLPPKPVSTAAQPAAAAAEAAHKSPHWMPLVAAQQVAAAVALHKELHWSQMAAQQAVAVAAAPHKLPRVQATFWVASQAELTHLAHQPLLCFRLPASAQLTSLLAASSSACQEGVSMESTALRAPEGPSSPHRSLRSWPSCLADQILGPLPLRLFGLRRMQWHS